MMFTLVVIVLADIVLALGYILSRIRDKEIHKEISTLLENARNRAKRKGTYYEGYPYRSDGLIDCSDKDVEKAVHLMHTHYFLGVIPITFDPWG
jgi:hypothetical protein